MRRARSSARTAGAVTSSSVRQLIRSHQERVNREGKIRAINWRRIKDFSFGSIRIDGTTYEHDVVIESREIPRAQEKAIEKIP